ncbi:MAG: alanine racemase [Bacteroidota bacterium]
MTATYFEQLSQTLKEYPRAIPFLLVDLDRLDKNLVQLQRTIRPEVDFRIVVKSLPCVELIDYLMEKTPTNKLMVFHQPFLTDLASRLNDQADVLLGKPFPIKTATYFYNHLPDLSHGFNPYSQIQWLVDTSKRIEEYIQLAKQLGQRLRLNIEIDVGLHRGGFSNISELATALQLLVTNQAFVTFSGLMGYDPHVVKLPSIVRSPTKALQLANTFYEDCKKAIQQDFPSLWSNQLTFNGAGSPTISLHQGNSPLNDVSAGSCLVKPTTFDLPTLKDFQPACYIATPVLKAFEGTTLPAMERMKGLLNVVSSSNQQSFFIYGGFWKADYCYPVGVQQNSLFVSTNQNMLNAPKSVQLDVDDFVFLRPHQSEFVFLQFGKVLVVRGGKIVEEWQLLRNY